MIRARLIIGAGIFLTVFAVVGELGAIRPSASAHAAAESVQPQSLAEQFLLLLNRDRRAAGVPEFLRDDDVQAVAIERAEEMAAHDRAEHADAAGVGAAELLDRRGVNFRELAENIGVYPGPADMLSEALHRLWIESPDHRANLLDARYRRAGIGVAAAGGAFYVVQLFVD